MTSPCMIAFLIWLGLVLSCVFLSTLWGIDLFLRTMARAVLSGRTLSWYRYWYRMTDAEVRAFAPKEATERRLYRIAGIAYVVIGGGLMILIIFACILAGITREEFGGGSL